MTETKHTPGPWVKTFDHSLGRTVVQKSEFGPGPIIFETPENDLPIEEIDANSLLAAAAPDLLEALDTILAHQGIYGAVLNAWKKESGGEEKAHAIFRQARAAIAKATT